MKKINLMLSMMLLGTFSFAGQIPVVIPFIEGEQLNVSLSRVNFNRVFVEGEKIVQVSYPQGGFDVDKSETSVPDLKEGSVYIKPMFDAELTVFFATDMGHHFSMTVKADDAFGKTLRLLSKNQKTLEYVKAPATEVTAIEEVMQAMIAGEIPRDFKNERVVPRSFYVKKDLKLSVEKLYRGENLTGYVYRIENKANHDVALTTALFANQKAESLSLSTDKLGIGQVAYLYGLYSNQG